AASRRSQRTGFSGGSRAAGGPAAVVTAAARSSSFGGGQSGSSVIVTGSVSVSSRKVQQNSAGMAARYKPGSPAPDQPPPDLPVGRLRFTPSSRKWRRSASTPP